MKASVVKTATSGYPGKNYRSLLTSSALKEVSRVFQESFKGVSKRLKGVSIEF